MEIATLSVITFSQCIDGVSVEDAETDSFQATLVAAVGSQIESDTEEEHTVKVTGVSLDGTCGGPVVQYEVLDVCPSHLDTMVTSLETRYEHRTILELSYPSLHYMWTRLYPVINSI